MLILFVFILGFVNVFGCGPGNKEDLGKLEFFLGLKVEEKGVDNTDYSENFIDEANELNCDFQNVKDCKWTNAPTDNITDHLDYYLFEKTSEKIWSLADLRPGNNPPLGAKMLLAGDKGLNPKAAVWYSSPIKCQKDHGTINFDYWLYNEALIEVVLIKPNSDPLSVIMRPFQSCEKAKSVGSQCVVIIPPQNAPFQIGIRAHNLKSPIGSIALLDNIEYEAEICSNKYDLGSNFVEKPMQTGRAGNFIVDSEDLQCDSMDASCRWENVKGQSGGNVEWFTGSGRIDKQKWSKHTGTRIVPSGDFAMTKYDKGSSIDEPRSVLYSDPIPCQAGNSIVQFRYWLTPGTKLKVCALTLDNLDEISCSNDVGEFTSPGPVKVTIPGPIDDEFVLAFEAYDFNQGNGGFVAVDDIEYDARLCTEITTTVEPEGPTDPWDLGPGLEVEELIDGTTGDYVEHADSLDCDYEPAGILGTLCQWGNGRRNGNENNAKWQLGGGDLDTRNLQELTGTNEAPDGKFGYIRFDKAGSGSLLSDPMVCLNSDAFVTINYWTSDNVKLEICALRERDSAAIFCQNVAEPPAPGPALVTIPGTIDEPWLLRTRAVSSGKGFAMLDEVSVVADLCTVDDLTTKPPPTKRTTTTTTTTTERTTTKRQQTDEEKDIVACRAVTCNYESGLCGYSSKQVDGSNAKFIMEDNTIGVSGNVEVGKAGDHFLGTTLRQNAKTAVLESPTFKIHKARVIHFDYSRGTFGSQLWVCPNELDLTFNKCNKIAGPGLKLGEWQGTSSKFRLKKNTKKFYIVASHNNFRSGPASFTLDNFRMKNTKGRDLC